MNAGPGAPPRVRYRVRFAKIDLLRWISHRDLAMLWDRLGRRVGLHFSMTEGFHPKPRINFPSALALGIESDNEIVELDLETPLEPAELLSRLISDAQPGLTIHRVERLPDGFGKSRVATLHYRIDPPDGMSVDEIDAGIARVQSTETAVLKRKKKDSTVVLADQIHSLSRRDDGSIELVQRDIAGALIKPDELIAMMPIDDFVRRGGKVRRTDVRLSNPYTGDDAATAASSSPPNTFFTHE